MNECVHARVQHMHMDMLNFFTNRTQYGLDMMSIKLTLFKDVHAVRFVLNNYFIQV